MAIGRIAADLAPAAAPRAARVGATIICNGGDTQWAHGSAIAAGLATHGVDVNLVRNGGQVRPGDFVVVWGWRHAQRHMAKGLRALVMERGYVDRFRYSSLAWDGLNGRGRFCLPAEVAPARFLKLFPDQLKPWKPASSASMPLALILGQVATDAAVMHTNIVGWYQDAANLARGKGYRVAFRKHPNDTGRPPAGLPLIGGDLAAALAEADLAITYNSNSGVDAALAGVPVVTIDAGAMAWPIASHVIDRGAVAHRPDRLDWAGRLAHCQWTMDEMKAGAFWKTLQTGLITEEKP